MDIDGAILICKGNMFHSLGEKKFRFRWLRKPDRPYVSIWIWEWSKAVDQRIYEI